MSNMPHGRVGHISLNCDDCTELKTHDDDVVVIDDPELGRVEIRDYIKTHEGEVIKLADFVEKIGSSAATHLRNLRREGSKHGL